MKNERTRHQERVEEFMRKARQVLPSKPTIPTLAVRTLRAKLIFEEALEKIHGLGLAVMHEHPDMVLHFQIRKEHLAFDENGLPDLVEIVDGCCDVSVIAIGTLSACGVRAAPLLKLVDKNNLAKFGPGHSIREDGKLIKPPGHKPPDIEGELRRQGWEG